MPKTIVRISKSPDDVLRDPLFSQETYDMDPYYDAEMQADLRRQMAEIESGKAELVDYETLKKRRKANVQA